MSGCGGMPGVSTGTPVRIVWSFPMRPLRTSSTARAKGRSERNSLSVRETTPARATASHSARPSATEIVSGFSTETCLPAFTASIAIGTCQWSGVAIITASTSARASTSRKSRCAVHPRQPSFPACAP